MGTTSKCPKFLEELETLESEDRISNLPENLIGHILSLLPTKYAVGTSALSTFWKNQWTSTPNLNFDDTMLINRPKFETSIRVKMIFVNFIHRVMDLHQAPQICRFRLKSHHSDLSSHLNTWISVVLARKVQKLELDLLRKGVDALPCEIFTSSTLVELRLGLWFLLDIPSLVRLPNLRAMHLYYIMFTNKESSERLFSSCPVLEDLTIIYCRCVDNSILNISSTSVKRLTVESGRCQYTVELNTPRLEHFNYIGRLADGFLSNRLEFLAKVCFHMPSYLDDKETIKVLARGISNVQYLYLSGEILETLKKSRVDFQPFCNVRTLVIGYNGHGAWQMLPLLLDKCPNLKHLELNDGLYGEEIEDGYFKWVPPEVVPACLSLHLEGITLHAFKGKAEEMKMIEYLLINSKVLKKVIVKSAMDAQKERIIREKLFHVTWARGLRDCEVVFNSLRRVKM